MKRKILKKEVSVVAIIAFSLVVVFLGFYCFEINQEIDLNYSSILNILIYQEDEINKEDKNNSSGKDDIIKDDSDKQVDVCKSAFLEIESSGLYYSSEGDQLGVGPLPPKVDVQTNYWVFWKVDGLNKNLSDLSVSAELPENVVWTNNKSLLAGKLQFGEVSRRVVWEVDEIKKDGNYRVGFEIGVIPKEKDINQILDLLTEIEYVAFDKECQKQVKGVLKNITTDLEKDNLASGKGKVESY